MLAWASKVEKPILSEAFLKRQLRKTTKHSEDDIQLLFAHMKFTGRLCVHSVNSQEDDPELTLCKLANPASKQCEEISVKEKGQFALQTQLQRTEARIEQMRSRRDKCHADV